MLVVAYLSSYVVGSAISFWVLSRTLGGLQVRQLLRFLVRMAVVLAFSAAATWVSLWALAGLGDDPHPVVAMLRAGVAGLVGGVVVLLGARTLHIREVTSLVDTVAARLPRAR